MPRLLASHLQMIGLPPGTPVFMGDRRADRVTIHAIDYNKEGVTECNLSAPEDCAAYLSKPTVTWINVTGLHEPRLLERIASVFGIHHLALEDIVNTDQRPKVEDYGDFLFIVVKMLYRHPKSPAPMAEHVCLVVGRNYVLSFQELEGDIFDTIRQRIAQGKGRIRAMGADYLAYSLIDAIVDNYYVVFEQIGGHIDALQDMALRQVDASVPQLIQALRRDLAHVRKILWPMREVVGLLQQSESRLMARSLAPYLRNLYQHAVQVSDTLESMREMLSSSLELYLTHVSNRMNEIMKVLTIIATIFIPLTFITGVYGMNFQHLPELRWRYGYAAFWMVILAVVGGMVVYFKRRKWI